MMKIILQVWDKYIPRDGLYCPASKGPPHCARTGLLALLSTHVDDIFSGILPKQLNDARRGVLLIWCWTWNIPRKPQWFLKNFYLEKPMIEMAHMRLTCFMFWVRMKAVLQASYQIVRNYCTNRQIWTAASPYYQWRQRKQMYHFLSPTYRYLRTIVVTDQIPR